MFIHNRQSAMMESLRVALAVFGLLSLGQTAPTTNCESLTQQIQMLERDQMLGRWNYIAESTSIFGSKELLENSRGTVWLNTAAAPEKNILIYTMHLKMLGQCFTLTLNSTLENNTFTFAYPYLSTGVQLQTGCPDCMVVYSNITLGFSSYRGLQLTSRRQKVSSAELEEFQRQVECLNLPKAGILDPEQGFCPDPSLSKDLRSIDMTSFMGTDNMNMLDEVFRSGRAIKILSDMFSYISST